jgi:hypothetical protein
MPIDSQSWICGACGVTYIGHRPASGICPECTAASAGPFETERQAAELPSVRAVYEAMREWTGPVTSEQREAIDAMTSALIISECERAGVRLGAYDARIVAWLGNWEPQTCAVIAGLIRRAYAAGAAGRKSNGT